LTGLIRLKASHTFHPKATHFFSFRYNIHFRRIDSDQLDHNLDFTFQEESSVQQLIDACIQDDDKLYLCVSSPTIKDKPVQIRPWKLSDADYVLDASMPLDPRKTVFVGGVPRPLKAGISIIHDHFRRHQCYETIT